MERNTRGAVYNMCECEKYIEGKDMRMHTERNPRRKKESSPMDPKQSLSHLLQCTQLVYSILTLFPKRHARLFPETT